MTDEELWYQMRLNELPPDAMVAEAAQVDPALRNQVKVCPTCGQVRPVLYYYYRGLTERN